MTAVYIENVSYPAKRLKSLGEKSPVRQGYAFRLAQFVRSFVGSMNEVLS